MTMHYTLGQRELLDYFLTSWGSGENPKTELPTHIVIDVETANVPRLGPLIVEFSYLIVPCPGDVGPEPSDSMFATESGTVRVNWWDTEIGTPVRRLERDALKDEVNRLHQIFGPSGGYPTPAELWGQGLPPHEAVTILLDIVDYAYERSIPIAWHSVYSGGLNALACSESAVNEESVEDWPGLNISGFNMVLDTGAVQKALGLMDIAERDQYLRDSQAYELATNPLSIEQEFGSQGWPEWAAGVADFRIQGLRWSTDHCVGYYGLPSPEKTSPFKSRRDCTIVDSLLDMWWDQRSVEPESDPLILPRSPGGEKS